MVQADTEKAVKECPHCFSEIDARATACSQCRRDIPEKSLGENQEEGERVIGTVLAVVVLSVLVFAWAASTLGDSRRTGVSIDPVEFPDNCSYTADTFKERADELMADYLQAHSTGSQGKSLLRTTARGMSEPVCAPDAKDAIFDWFDAVDADDQQGMHEADERFLDALE